MSVTDRSLVMVSSAAARRLLPVGWAVAPAPLVTPPLSAARLAALGGAPARRPRYPGVAPRVAVGRRVGPGVTMAAAATPSPAAAAEAAGGGAEYPRIDLYSWGTPNGKKVTIALELLGIPYTHHSLPLSRVKEPWFVALCPNGRIPAIAVNAPAPQEPPPKPENDADAAAAAASRGAPELALMESGAILLYLSDLAGGRLLGDGDAAKKASILQWLMWQMGGVGPMFGQANFFDRLPPTTDGRAFGVARYTAEGERLLGVLDAALATRDWVATADGVSMADVAIYPWVVSWLAKGRSAPDAHPHVRAWAARMEALDGVKRGMAVYA